MPPSSLPARPNLGHLRSQAKDLLRAYRAGHRSSIARFRAYLPHCSNLPDDDVRRLSLSLGDAQRVIAAEYGFHSWLEIRNYVRHKRGYSMIEMTVDHVRMNYMSDMRVVILKAEGGDTHLPIFMGRAEGDSIAMMIEGQEMPRPMTYQIVHRMIGDLGGQVDRVVVNDIVDGIYLATLRVRSGEREIDYDVRPSDAIALAVLTGAPVFATPEVLDKGGYELNPETGEMLPPNWAKRESGGHGTEGHALGRNPSIESVLSGHWHTIGAAGQ